MGIFFGLSCIGTSVWNMRVNKNERALYALGIPLGICCILMQVATA